LQYATAEWQSCVLFLYMYLWDTFKRWQNS
jgi:hypothetical protein